MLKQRSVYFVLLFGLLGTCLVSLRLGTVSIASNQLMHLLFKPFGYSSSVEVSIAQETVFWSIRLPRVLFGVLIGIALGSAGTALQGIFRNPLVDSGLIGIASGASLFASAFILLFSVVPMLVLGSPQLTLATVAFFGAALTALLVYRIALSHGKINTVLLILAGVALNALSGSLTGLLTFFADDKQLRDLTFWTLGSLSGANWTNVSVLTLFVLLPFAVLLRTSTSLNAFALGESQAHSVGVHVQKTKTIVLVCSTAMVGAAVAFSGVIGFVGLVIPHILRLILGPSYTNLLPLSAVAGALLVCLSDLVCRLLLQPVEIPIGIVTALLGTPVLLWIILKQKKSNIG